VIELFLDSCLEDDPLELLEAVRMKLGDVLKVPVEDVEGILSAGQNVRLAPQSWVLKKSSTKQDSGKGRRRTLKDVNDDDDDDDDDDDSNLEGTLKVEQTWMDINSIQEEKELKNVDVEVLLKDSTVGVRTFGESRPDANMRALKANGTASREKKEHTISGGSENGAPQASATSTNQHVHDTRLESSTSTSDTHHDRPFYQKRTFSVTKQQEQERKGRRLLSAAIGQASFISPLSLGLTHSCYVGLDHQVRCWGWNNGGRIGPDTLGWDPMCCFPTSMCCAKESLAIDFGTTMPVNPNAGDAVEFYKRPKSFCAAHMRYGEYTEQNSAFDACLADRKCMGVYSDNCNETTSIKANLCLRDSVLGESSSNSCVYEKQEVVMRFECETCNKCGRQELQVGTTTEECLQRCKDDKNCYGAELGKGKDANNEGSCTISRVEDDNQPCTGFEYYKKTRGRRVKLDLGTPIPYPACYAGLGTDALMMMVDEDKGTYFKGSSPCQEYVNIWWIMFDTHSPFLEASQVEVTFLGANIVHKFEIGACDTKDGTGICDTVECDTKYGSYGPEICSFPSKRGRYWRLRVLDIHTSTGNQPLFADVQLLHFLTPHPYPVTQVASGQNGHNCALIRGRVKCWGSNDIEQAAPRPAPSVLDSGIADLAYIDTQNIKSGNDDDDVIMIATTSNSSCALHGDGSFTCWGSNMYGQLGSGNMESRKHAAWSLSRPCSYLTAGVEHYCAICGPYNWVSCWGRGGQGRLGTGDSKDRPIEAEIAWVRLFDASTGTPGANLSGCGSVSAGGDGSCALSGQELFCWGSNIYGQLGAGYFNTIIGGPHLVGGILGGVVSVSMGNHHVCVVDSSSAVFCWGKNSNGQLGLNDYEKRGVPVKVVDNAVGITAGGDGTCAYIKSVLSPYCWGKNSYGNLGFGGTNDHTSTSYQDQFRPRRVILPASPLPARAWLLELKEDVTQMTFYASRSCTEDQLMEASELLPPHKLGVTPYAGFVTVLFPMAAEVRCIQMNSAIDSVVVKRWNGYKFLDAEFSASEDGNFLIMTRVCASNECVHGNCVDGYCACEEHYEGSTCEIHVPPETNDLSGAPAGVPCGDIMCYEGDYCTITQKCVPTGTCGGFLCGSHGKCINDMCHCAEGYAGKTCMRELATQSIGCKCLEDWSDPYTLANCSTRSNLGCCSPDGDPRSWCLDDCDGGWHYCERLWYCDPRSSLKMKWKSCQKSEACVFQGYSEGDCCPTSAGEMLSCCPEFVKKCSFWPQCVSWGYTTDDCCPNANGFMLGCCSQWEDGRELEGIVSVEQCQDECAKVRSCSVLEYLSREQVCNLSYKTKTEQGYYESLVTPDWQLCEPRMNACMNSGHDCGPHGSCITVHDHEKSAFQCECDDGWGGIYCDIDPCLEIHCGVHGECNGLMKACECETGWSGAECEKVGSTNVGARLTFRPRFRDFTYGALEALVRVSVAQAVSKNAGLQRRRQRRLKSQRGGMTGVLGEFDKSNKEDDDVHKNVSSSMMKNGPSGDQEEMNDEMNERERQLSGEEDSVLSDRIYISAMSDAIVEFVMYGLNENTLNGLKQLEPGHFAHTPLSDICSLSDMSMEPSPIYVFNDTVYAMPERHHVVLQVHAPIDWRNVETLLMKGVLGWHDVRVRTVYDSVKYRALDLLTGARGGATYSEGTTNEERMASWANTTDENNKKELKYANALRDKDEDRNDNIVLIAVLAGGLSGVLVSSLIILYIVKRGPFKPNERGDLTIGERLARAYQQEAEIIEAAMARGGIVDPPQPSEGPPKSPLARASYSFIFGKRRAQTSENKKKAWNKEGADRVPKGGKSKSKSKSGKKPGLKEEEAGKTSTNKNNKKKHQGKGLGAKFVPFDRYQRKTDLQTTSENEKENEKDNNNDQKMIGKNRRGTWGGAGDNGSGVKSWVEWNLLGGRKRRKNTEKHDEASAVVGKDRRRGTWGGAGDDEWGVKSWVEWNLLGGRKRSKNTERKSEEEEKEGKEESHEKRQEKKGGKKGRGEGGKNAHTYTKKGQREDSALGAARGSKDVSDKDGTHEGIRRVSWSEGDDRQPSRQKRDAQQRQPFPDVNDDAKNKRTDEHQNQETESRDKQMRKKEEEARREKQANEDLLNMARQFRAENKAKEEKEAKENADDGTSWRQKKKEEKEKEQNAAAAAAAAAEKEEKKNREKEDEENGRSNNKEDENGNKNNNNNAPYDEYCTLDGTKLFEEDEEDEEEKEAKEERRKSWRQNVKYEKGFDEDEWRRRGSKGRGQSAFERRETDRREAEKEREAWKEEKRRLAEEMKFRRQAEARRQAGQEPEAEPAEDGAGAGAGTEYRQHKTTKEKAEEATNNNNLIKPPSYTAWVDITQKENLDPLCPLVAGSDFDCVTKKISQWISANLKQDIEARKKAIKMLLVLWHPDKNAEIKEEATAVFQFIQSKKDFFLLGTHK